MPVITIQVVKGTLDQECKAEMAKRVSEVVAEIECRPYPKENTLPWTFCIIQEIEAENFVLNGMPATPEMLEAVRAGKVHMTVD